MEEIQVGEYVRTNYGIIDKIINKDDKNYFLDGEKGIIVDLKDRIGTPISDITKHSKNIIDLIEVGDFVNGNRVYKVTNACIYCIGKAVQNKFTINIQTILTHEQFENNYYRIEE